MEGTGGEVSCWQNRKGKEGGEEKREGKMGRVGGGEGGACLVFFVT